MGEEATAGAAAAPQRVITRSQSRVHRVRYNIPPQCHSRFSNQRAGMDMAEKISCTPILISLLWMLMVLESNCGGGARTSPPPPPVLSIVTVSLVDGMVTFPYRQTIQAAGGVAPFTWSVSSGSLPHSLTLGSSSTNSATVSGTADTAQAATFAIQVKDAKSQIAVQSYTLNINRTGLAQVQPVTGQVPAGMIEIQGVSAGPFNPLSWQQNTLNWMPDVRTPMLAPQPGLFQNIYSPWPLKQPNGWQLFYGGRNRYSQ